MRRRRGRQHAQPDGDECTEFGAGLAGCQPRDKCTDLPNAEATKALVLDWAGVALVSLELRR